MLQSRAARNAACAKTYFDPSIRLPGRLDLVPRFRLISGLERTVGCVWIEQSVKRWLRVLGPLGIEAALQF